MARISKTKVARVGLIVVGIAVISLTTAVVLTHSTPSASASSESTLCSAKGDITNAPDGTGIVFTVTTNGTCKDAPLILTSIDPEGNKKVLATLPLTSNSDGTKVVSVSFIPDKTVASYVVNVAQAFSATVTP